MYTMSTAKRAKMQEAASADMYDCRGHNPIMAISPTIAGDWFLRCYRLGLACFRRWRPLLVLSGAGFFRAWPDRTGFRMLSLANIASSWVFA